MGISGQLIFRKASPELCRETGKNLMMVVGVLAVPEGLVEGETQYVVTGFQDPCDDGRITLEVHPSTATPLTETKHLATTLGQLLLEPIWRV
jgi:hypothetical protein